MNIIDNLANTIIKGDCVLFAGSGISQKSRGLSWDELIDFLITQLNYSSPLLNNRDKPQNKIHIIDDIFSKYDPKVVYDIISERLKDAKISDDYSNLMKLPWFSVFTTNYDTALEDALTTFQSPEKIVRPIFRGNEFFLPGRHRELLCIKLMGSCNVPYGLPGAMVLTSGQLGKAEREKDRIFDELVSHAASLSFLFVGYSFDDNIFIKNLKRLQAELGKPEKKFFAVFRDEPLPEKRYILESMGIEILICDLAVITKKIYDKYVLLDPTNYSQIRFQIGETLVPVEKKSIFDFLDNYNVVDYNDISTPVPAYHFFKGDTKGLFPYKEKWHFLREETNELINVIIDRTKNPNVHIICIAGNLGTGRTFTIKAAIYDLITKHNSVTIRLQKNAINSLPDASQIIKFKNEVTEAAKKQGITESLKFIFWAEYTPDPELLLRFESIAQNTDIPIFLIFEEVANEKYIDDLSKEVKLLRVDICDSIYGEKRDELINYLVETSRRHKFQESSKIEITRIVNEEKEFLPIVYRTIDPSKDSVDQIVEAEFSKLYSDEKTRDIILYSCLSSCVNLEIPISILLKVFRNQYYETNLSYDSIFRYGDQAYQFININPDRYYGYLLSIYHPIIAQKIVRIVGHEKIDEYLLRIAQVVDVHLPIDAKFVRALFITKGVNNLKSDLNFYKIAATEKGLLQAFHEIYERQPARPIIHHYARLIKFLEPDNKDAIRILLEALPEPEIKYGDMYERKANIQTTLANFKWDFNKATLLTKNRSDPELFEIFNLLEKAQKADEPNIHAYIVHARILMDIFDYKPNIEEKVEFLTEAIDKVTDGKSLLSNDDFSSKIRLDRLYDRIFESISSINYERALHIAEMMAADKDGKGFYLLARKASHEGDPEKSFLLIEKSLDCEKYPVNAVLLKIQLLFSKENPPYSELLRVADSKSIPVDKETWETAYYKGIIYTINGLLSPASRFFSLSKRLVPRDKKTKIFEYWIDNGKPKLFRGKILSGMTESDGKIYDHKIKGCENEIFFDPRSTRNDKNLSVGMDIQFELGFSSLSPVAVAVKPYDPKQTKIEYFK